MDLVTEPFPARTKTAAAEVNGIHTEVMSVSFADKILITITQGGRLAQWVCSSNLSLDLPYQSSLDFPGTCSTRFGGS